MKIIIADEAYRVKKHSAPSDFNCVETPVLVSGTNDWIAFQIIFLDHSDYAVSVGSSTYFPLKDRVTDYRVSVCSDAGFEASVNIVGFADDDYGKLVGDILLNDEHMYCEKNTACSVFTEVKIPDSAKSGIYDINIKVYAHKQFGDENESYSFTLKHEVYDCTLPQPENQKFYLDLWQHNSNIARKHEVRIWSDEHFNIIEPYIKSLGELGQKAVTVIASEIPWSGQSSFIEPEYLSDMFEYSMINVKKDISGAVICDFSIVQRYIDLCFSYGIKEEIEIFGLINIWTNEEYGFGNPVSSFHDAIRVRAYFEQDGCHRFLSSPEDITCYIKNIYEYFIEKGLIAKVRIVADEPADTEMFFKRMYFLKEIAPEFKYKTAINNLSFMENYSEQLTDFVPILSCACEGLEMLKQLKNKIKGRLLYYVCCHPPYPNNFLISPLIENRFIPILAAYMGFDGFLRWNYTAWPENPRQKCAYKTWVFHSGDTHFVYPSNGGKPLLSLRYKQLKRGIQDYELLCTADDETTKLVFEIIIKNYDFSKLYVDKKEKMYSTENGDYVKAKRLLLKNHRRVLQ